MKKTEGVFESFLWNFRFVILLAVLGLLAGSLVAFFVGLGSLYHAIELILQYGFNAKSNMVISHLIASLDEFLLGVVLIIFSLGVYELFISKIDAIDTDTRANSKWLAFTSLGELKSVLTSVLVIILMVYFFKNVVVMEFSNPRDVLYLAGGILLIALAQYLSSLPKKKGKR